MHDSGGADTCGWGMPITSAVAILFSCFDGGTDRSESLAIGRACRPLVTLKAGYYPFFGLSLRFYRTALLDTTLRGEKFRLAKLLLPSASSDYTCRRNCWMRQIEQFRAATWFHLTFLQLRGQPMRGVGESGLIGIFAPNSLCAYRSLACIPVAKHIKC